MSELKLQWNKLEDRDYSKLNYLRGIYLFALKRFGGAPFYVGTAGNGSSLGSKLAAHAELFHECKRMFYRNLDGDSAEDFVFHWARIQMSDGKNDYVFTPGEAVTEELRRESVRFFNELDIYYCVLSDEDTRRVAAEPPAALRLIEARIQTMIRDHYKTLHRRASAHVGESYTIGAKEATKLKIRFECADKDFYLSKLDATAEL